MRINHNIASLNTYRQLSMNSANGSKSLEKLSSGLRINKAGDDAAGLAISEKMRGQIRGLDQASRNAQDGISMIQTAEGALNETHSILQRMRELAVQSANDTNVDVDRSEIQKEIDELAKEVTRIANSTEFNTQKLINGAKTDTGSGSMKFHVGANAAQDITLSINAVDAKTLGISRDKTTAATGTADGTDITAATFAGDMGAGIVDGAELTFAYDAGDTATNASWASAAVAANTAGSITFNGITVNLTVAGASGPTVGVGTVAVGIAAGGTSTNSSDAIVAALDEYKLSGSTDVLDGFTFTSNGGVVEIAADAAGAQYNTLSIGGTLAGAATRTDGANATSDTLTITSSEGNVQKINVVGTEDTLTVSNGSFAGMTLTFDTDIATNAGGDVTISAQTTAATAAVFTNGALTTEAVTEAGIDVSTQANASNAISTIQNAIETVSAERSKLGAYQNRLEHTIANLGTSSENLTAAESRVRDVDMAKEMMEFTKNNILTQAAQAMLAQANQQPQGVLQLLR